MIEYSRLMNETIKNHDELPKLPIARYNTAISEQIFGHIPTFDEIRNKFDPDGKSHDITYQCCKCSTSQSCRCTKPKTLWIGICDKCSGGNMNFS